VSLQSIIEAMQLVLYALLVLTGSRVLARLLDRVHDSKTTR